MNTYPLPSMDITSATKMQFKLVDCITKHFEGHEIISRGDLGVVQAAGLNKPTTTHKAEMAIADFLGAEKCLLVRGAGTGAIRLALFAALKPGGSLLLHNAPIYNTTQTTLEMMGLQLIQADFNNRDNIAAELNKKPDAALIQFTRQRPDDAYDMKTVIETIKNYSNIPIVTDDNYAAMKVPEIGCQLGAHLSCFSAFKLLGPEGVGILCGKESLINTIAAHQYSGGCQVQGHEALDVLRGLVYAPVALAIQAQVIEELCSRLNGGEISGVKRAYIVNAQSKVLLVAFERPIARQILKTAQALGAAPNPVGAESKYEIAPLFYRVSGTFLAADPSLSSKMIRINPMRSGADTVLRILNQSIEKVMQCS